MNEFNKRFTEILRLLKAKGIKQIQIIRKAKKKMMMSKQMDFICDLIDMIQPNNSKENSDNEN